MKKAAIFALLITFFYSCGSKDRGELVGVNAKKKWFSEKPYGMALIPGGSFTMGKQDQDMIGSLNAPTKTVTVRPYYMDETEITNNEYKEFVFWVRDSVVRTRLAYQAEFASLGNANPDPNGKKRTAGIQQYAFKTADTTNLSPYQKYMFENYYQFDTIQPLNWQTEIVWNKNEYPDTDYVEVMDSLYIKKDDAVDGVRTFNTKFLNYKYSWFDRDNAARKGGDRKNFVQTEVLNIYPDTTVWVKDFNYSYNDPMHQDYFYHQSYGDYPVVGVTWNQANAFCNWRTKKKNDFLRGQKNVTLVPEFRLPTEAEWEYAARGGLEFATYPWGTGSTTSDRGCFLANFKPVRGNYAVDGALYTMEAKSFNANDYGLYNMAGNVSEWTNTAYNQSSYYMASTMNPNVEDRNNKRKITRGGSWKDVAYFLEVGSRDFEYADTARSYIGFRTVQNYIGTGNK
ncbi:MAG: gliding motility lipoprotein GldK [Flavobacteriia bacterium]|nr:gliding motility lipoprotein GldK [Flavobacteriia bacterium]OIP48118.1 MAG: gliding motility lipoprotein GldK [Flavobacteriaceae bacterium CG2_30_31_66]PIV97826.1 MAG: gliding motility lipoprotein GldK [Flavobacteriaceae bacterium CG17_big_fil_post_rev_8_21_14_2_50_31_13]PIX11592.1 MAG: gliding motility lipoprotein GldK [Flavobacteriaceae bacterium CG_4_8_14_3_um_filter_31_8]PIY14567.1 MAG: gliding motility lipoprotein GldK [Flavobacteriaceae bacterium CG_4_10_14_3_um_filter_31_253]PIZ10835